MKTIVVLSGAGISAESGIKTFRDSDGLWEEYRIEDVATPQAWHRNPSLVLEFYNQRRKQLLTAEPNAAHLALVRLEEKYNVQIITQNVDDLHERAGSTQVLHLHGELKKARSTVDEELIYDINGSELNTGELCEKGSQLRPHIVWFGEAVPMIVPAARFCQNADFVIVIGTSMQVYPAAGLLEYAKTEILKFLVDPNAPDKTYVRNLTTIRQKAGIGLPPLVDQLLAMA
jgi:NAD-dependent deacetylase